MKTAAIIITLLIAWFIPIAEAQQKIQGALITDKYQIDEIENHANSFYYNPISLSDLQELLEYNNNRLLPIIDILDYFRDSDRVYIWRDTQPLKAILKDYQIGLLMDEPMHNIRLACTAGNIYACGQVNQNYPDLRWLVNNIKNDMPDYIIIHSMAYPEIIAQNWRPMPLAQADYVAFGCYGAVDNCGGYHLAEYGFSIYNSLLANQQMFLVVGAFNFQGVIEHIDWYFSIYTQYPERFAGIGVFLWGSIEGFTGARDIVKLKSRLAFWFDQIKDY